MFGTAVATCEACTSIDHGRAAEPKRGSERERGFGQQLGDGDGSEGALPS